MDYYSILNTTEFGWTFAGILVNFKSLRQAGHCTCTLYTVPWSLRILTVERRRRRRERTDGNGWEFILCCIHCYPCCSVNRWGITWDNERWRSDLLYGNYLCNMIKDPLPISANDTIKVPLWLHAAAFPGFSQEVIKLEKTMYKNAESKLKSLSLEWACLPRPGTTFYLIWWLRERRVALLAHWLHGLMFYQTERR